MRDLTLRVATPVEPALIVLAKSPEPGRVKTRCSPPCSPLQAAALAAAALEDTLAVAIQSSAQRLVVALDGTPGGWLPVDTEVITQCDGSLGVRLDHAFRSVGRPALLIGMDTPQVTVAMLDAGLDLLRRGSTDSVVGPSADGGFWALGQSRHDADVCATVPMSRADTYTELRRSLSERAMTCALLPMLVDVDDFDTACDVARLVPGTRFARAVTLIAVELEAV